MIYGLYLSASGILTNSYRQDVIANNIANQETIGFKRDLALFQQRPTASQEMPGHMGQSNPILEGLGGGIFASPTVVDSSQGELQSTGNNLDCAIEGHGFFTVDDHGQTRLTRNGQFIINSDNQLILANGEGQRVLSDQGTPITLDPSQPVTINRFGVISQNEKPVGKLGLINVANPAMLSKQGGTMLTYPADQATTPATGVIHSQFLELGNVEPANELVALMDAQRQLEANANMIRCQDETLDQLVNNVAKLS